MRNPNLPTVPLLLIFIAIISTVYSIKCTVCDFRSQPPYDSPCNETCEGDVCFIVVGLFFNTTINAGCMHLRPNDTFNDKAICKRTGYDNRCACDYKDFCNTPKAKLDDFLYSPTRPVLEQYQWLPQIQPPSAGLQPILPPPEELPGDMNVTATELENGVEDDLANELEQNSSPTRSTGGNGRTTKILRNEESDDVLTVTTTIGLNVRDHSQRINTSQNDVAEDSDDTTTMRSFTPGQGSVEVTKVTQEAQSPSAEISNRNSNLTTSDGSEIENPNSSESLNLFLATILPILMHKLVMA